MDNHDFQPAEVDGKNIAKCSKCGHEWWGKGEAKKPCVAKVSKFHVGDRWADNIDDEWWLYYDDISEGLRGVRTRDGVSHWFVDGKNKLYSVTLTRLISSERWIPSAEMMPEAAPGDRRVVVAFGKGVVPMWSYMSDPQLPAFLAEVEKSGVYTHWRFLQPPEASC